MTDRLRFVYFDLDDTLLDHRSAERKALADLAGFIWGRDTRARGQVMRLQETYARNNSALWHAYADGDINRDELRELRFRHIVDAFSITGKTWQELDTFYMDQYSTHWSTVDGAREAFETISSRIDVGVITNGFADVQRAKLARFPFIRARSRAVVISEEVGFLKPDRRLFARAAEEAAVAAGDILYVGDSYRSDVMGAVRAGWMAAWFTEEPSEELPDRAFAFDDWSTLLARVP